MYYSIVWGHNELKSFMKEHLYVCLDLNFHNNFFHEIFTKVVSKWWFIQIRIADSKTISPHCEEQILPTKVLRWALSWNRIWDLRWFGTGGQLSSWISCTFYNYWISIVLTWLHSLHSFKLRLSSVSLESISKGLKKRMWIKIYICRYF